MLFLRGVGMKMIQRVPMENEKDHRKKLQPIKSTLAASSQATAFPATILRRPFPREWVCSTGQLSVRTTSGIKERSRTETKSNSARGVYRNKGINSASTTSTMGDTHHLRFVPQLVANEEQQEDRQVDVL